MAAKKVNEEDTQCSVLILRATSLARRARDRSSPAERLFSFENIWTSLGIRASHIRAALSAWRDAQRAGSTADGAGRETAPHRRRFVHVTPPPVSTGHGRAA